MNETARSIPIDILGAKFSVRDTAALVRVNEVVLRQWLARGTVDAGEKPGRGIPREIAAPQVATLWLTSVLIKMGLPVSVASVLVSGIEKQWAISGFSSDVDVEGRLSRWLVVAPVFRWVEADDLWLEKGNSRRMWYLTDGMGAATGLVYRVGEFGVLWGVHDAKRPMKKFGPFDAILATGSSIAVNTDLILREILELMERSIKARYVTGQS